MTMGAPKVLLLLLGALPQGEASPSEATVPEITLPAVPRNLAGPQLGAEWERNTGIANCVVDIGVATMQLAQAGLGINHATVTCGPKIDNNGNEVKGKTSKQKQMCAAVALGITASFQYAAFFMSSAALDCSKSFGMIDEHARNQLACAADVQLLLASLTLIASAGTSVGDACKSKPDLQNRRLEETFHGAAPLKPIMDENTTARDLYKIEPPTRKIGAARNAEIADCVFDTAQVVLLFSRAGLFINSAVKDCSPDETNAVKCAADIGNMVGAFAFAGAGIANAVAHCPEWKKSTTPVCASAVLALIAATAKVQASATSMSIDCVPAKLASRRLGSNATFEALPAQFV